jgi:hypothetical protein
MKYKLPFNSRIQQAGHHIMSLPNTKSNATHTKDFCENYVPKLPDVLKDFLA